MIKEKKKDKMDEIGDKLHKATVARIRKINNKTVRRECLGLTGLLFFIVFFGCAFAALALVVCIIFYGGEFIFHNPLMLLLLVPVGAYMIGMGMDGGKKNGNTEDTEIRRNSPKRGHGGSKSNKVAGKKKSKPTKNNR